MSGWTPKRFWTDTTVIEAGGGFAISLDGRAVKTPAKADLVLPTKALAEAVAAEWAAQEGVIRPETMPVTRLANAAIDKVTAQKAEVAAMLAAYAETDLLCHRADEPAALVARQAEAWDPMLDWAAATHGARLVPVAGIIAARQDPEALARLAERVHALDVFRLAAFHDLVAITGSLILGLAIAEGRIDAEEGWRLSRIDDTWQQEHWGEDEEAAERAAHKRAALLTAAHIFSLL